MNKKFIQTILFLIVLAFQANSQRLNVSIANTGNNHIRVTGVATAPGFLVTNVPPQGTNSWGAMNITFRLPKAVAISPSPTVNPPFITPEITNEATGFTGPAPRDGFNLGLDLTMWDKTIFGAPDDNYWYFTIIHTVPGGLQTIPAGSSVVIYEFSLPPSWACTDCLEIVTFNHPDIPVGTASFIDNTGPIDNVMDIIDGMTSLPVVLTSFTAKKSGTNVLLNWATSLEENNKGFHIERSTSGQSWEVLGFVPGNNNSTTEQRYSFTDNNPQPGIINQYRLRQEDYDGRYDYSAVRKVDFSFKEPVGISLFPNPAGGEGVNISCEGFSSKVNVLLFNSNGILVRRLGNVTAQPSTGNINIETASLPPGLYMVEVTDSEGHRAVKKLVRR